MYNIVDNSNNSFNEYEKKNWLNKMSLLSTADQVLYNGDLGNVADAEVITN